MSPFSTDSTGPAEPTGPTSSATSTAASLRRHAILADLNLLQVATLMGTGLLVTLGVILGGRSYITTVTPDGLIASQPSAHGTSVQDPAAAPRVTLWAITRPLCPLHVSRPGPRPVW